MWPNSGLVAAPKQVHETKWAYYMLWYSESLLFRRLANLSSAAYYHSCDDTHCSKGWCGAQLHKIKFYTETENICFTFGNFITLIFWTFPLPGVGFYYGIRRFAKCVDSEIEQILSQHGTRLQTGLAEM